MSKKRVSETNRNLIQTQLLLVFTLITLFIIYLAFSSLRKAQQEHQTVLHEQVTQIVNVSNTNYDQIISLLNLPLNNNQLQDIFVRQYADSNPNSRYLFSQDRQVVVDIMNSNYFYQHPYIESVTILPGNGTMPYLHYSTTADFFKGDFNQLSNEAWSIRAMTSDKLFVGRIKKSKIQSGQHVISFYKRAASVVPHYKLIAITRIDVSMLDFQDSWTATLRGTGTKLLVFDSTGKVVMNNTGKKINNYTNFKANKRNIITGSLTAEKSDSQKLRYVAISKSTTQLPVALSTIITLVAIIVLVILLAFFYIIHNSKRIAQPISNLLDAMQIVEKGDFSVRVKPQAGEMGRLSTGFNSLVASTDKLIKNEKTKEQEASRLKYELLVSKINPHFLYNTLNAISGKAEIVGANDISKGLHDLVEILRFSSKYQQDTVLIETELHYLEAYVALMRLRYGDGVDLDYDIDPEVLQLTCLKYMLQPFVENSFIYAFSNQQTEKIITVKMFRQDSMIVSIIRDNGIGIATKQAQQKQGDQMIGTGIDNVDGRIKSKYGKRYGVEITSEAYQYTQIRITIPVTVLASKEEEK